MATPEHLGAQFDVQRAVEGWESDLSMEITHAAAGAYPSTQEHGWSTVGSSSELQGMASSLVGAINTAEPRKRLYSGHAYDVEHSPAKVGQEWHVPLMASGETPDVGKAWASEAPSGRGTVYVMHGAPAIDVNKSERLTSGRFHTQRVQGNRVHLKYLGPLEEG